MAKKSKRRGVEVISLIHGESVIDTYEGAEFWSEVDTDTGYLYISDTPQKKHAYNGYYAVYIPGSWVLARELS